LLINYKQGVHLTEEFNIVCSVVQRFHSKSFAAVAIAYANDILKVQRGVNCGLGPELLLLHYIVPVTNLCSLSYPQFTVEAGQGNSLPLFLV